MSPPPHPQVPFMWRSDHFYYCLNILGMGGDWLGPHLKVITHSDHAFSPLSKPRVDCCPVATNRGWGSGISQSRLAKSSRFGDGARGG